MRRQSSSNDKNLWNHIDTGDHDRWEEPGHQLRTQSQRDGSHHNPRGKLSLADGFQRRDGNVVNGHQSRAQSRRNDSPIHRVHSWDHQRRSQRARVHDEVIRSHHNPRGKLSLADGFQRRDGNVVNLPRSNYEEHWNHNDTGDYNQWEEHGHQSRTQSRRNESPIHRVHEAIRSSHHDPRGKLSLADGFQRKDGKILHLTRDESFHEKSRIGAPAEPVRSSHHDPRGKLSLADGFQRKDGRILHLHRDKSFYESSRIRAPARKPLVRSSHDDQSRDGSSSEDASEEQHRDEDDGIVISGEDEDDRYSIPFREPSTHEYEEPEQHHLRQGSSHDLHPRGRLSFEDAAEEQYRDEEEVIVPQERRDPVRQQQPPDNVPSSPEYDFSEQPFNYIPHRTCAPDTPVSPSSPTYVTGGEYIGYSDHDDQEMCNENVEDLVDEIGEPVERNDDLPSEDQGGDFQEAQYEDDDRPVQDFSPSDDEPQDEPEDEPENEPQPAFRTRISHKPKFPSSTIGADELRKIGQFINSATEKKSKKRAPRKKKEPAPIFERKVRKPPQRNRVLTQSPEHFDDITVIPVAPNVPSSSREQVVYDSDSSGYEVFGTAPVRRPSQNQQASSSHRQKKSNSKNLVKKKKIVDDSSVQKKSSSTRETKKRSDSERFRVSSNGSEVVPIRKNPRQRGRDPVRKPVIDYDDYDFAEPIKQEFVEPDLSAYFWKENDQSPSSSSSKNSEGDTSRKSGSPMNGQDPVRESSPVVQEQEQAEENAEPDLNHRDYHGANGVSNAEEDSGDQQRVPGTCSGNATIAEKSADQEQHCSRESENPVNNHDSSSPSDGEEEAASGMLVDGIDTLKLNPMKNNLKECNVVKIPEKPGERRIQSSSSSSEDSDDSLEGSVWKPFPDVLEEQDQEEEIVEPDLDHLDYHGANVDSNAEEESVDQRRAAGTCSGNGVTEEESANQEPESGESEIAMKPARETSNTSLEAASRTSPNLDATGSNLKKSTSVSTYVPEHVVNNDESEDSVDSDDSDDSKSPMEEQVREPSPGLLQKEGQAVPKDSDDSIDSDDSDNLNDSDDLDDSDDSGRPMEAQDPVRESTPVLQEQDQAEEIVEPDLGNRDFQDLVAESNAEEDSVDRQRAAGTCSGNGVPREESADLEQHCSGGSEIEMNTARETFSTSLPPSLDNEEVTGDGMETPVLNPTAHNAQEFSPVSDDVSKHDVHNDAESIGNEPILHLENEGDDRNGQNQNELLPAGVLLEPELEDPDDQEDAIEFNFGDNFEQQVVEQHGDPIEEDGLLGPMLLQRQMIVHEDPELDDVQEQVGRLGNIEKQVGRLGNIEKQVVPLGDVEEQVVPLGDVEEQVVPFGDVEEQVVPLGDVEEQVVPLGDVEEQVVPLGDVEEQVVPLENIEGQVEPLGGLEEQVIPLQDLPELQDQLDEELVAAAPLPQADPPVPEKRKRGRPPKAKPEEDLDNEPPAKRPRGRPPKNGKAAKPRDNAPPPPPEPQDPSAPAKRGRGRPRKNRDPKEEEADDQQPGPSNGKQGCSSQEEESEDEEEHPDEPKRKRGRPRGPQKDPVFGPKNRVGRPKKKE